MLQRFQTVGNKTRQIIRAHVARTRICVIIVAKKHEKKKQSKVLQRLEWLLVGGGVVIYAGVGRRIEAGVGRRIEAVTAAGVGRRIEGAVAAGVGGRRRVQ